MDRCTINAAIPKVDRVTVSSQLFGKSVTRSSRKTGSNEENRIDLVALTLSRQITCRLILQAGSLTVDADNQSHRDHDQQRPQSRQQAPCTVGDQADHQDADSHRTEFWRSTCQSRQGGKVSIIEFL